MAEENSICISCLETSDLQLLFESYLFENSIEVYGQMLESCFNIKVSRKEGLEYICSKCVQKLRNAVSFKNQSLFNMSLLMSDDGNVGAEYLDESVWDAEEDGKRPPEDYQLQQLLANAETGSLELLSQEPKSLGEMMQLLKEDPASTLVVVSSHDSSRRLKLEKKLKRRKKVRNSLEMVEQSRMTSPEQNICNLCDANFDSAKLLLKHMNVHHAHNMCSICGEGFDNKSQLRRHRCVDEDPQLSRTDDDNLARLKFKCPQCDRGFMSRALRARHLWRRHQLTKDRECSLCKQMFWSREQLIGHLERAHGDTKFCRFCGEEDGSLVCVRKHILLKVEHLEGDDVVQNEDLELEEAGLGLQNR